MRRYQRNVIAPASNAVTRYRQSLSAAGGTAPISTSRVMPPAFAAANDSTSTPKMSSRRLTPAAAPLSGEHEGADDVDRQHQRVDERRRVS